METGQKGRKLGLDIVVCVSFICMVKRKMRLRQRIQTFLARCSDKYANNNNTNAKLSTDRQ